VPALGPGATAVVTVVAPVASPAALGSEAPGVRVVLRDGDGIAWDDADALLSPSVDRLIDVAERLVAPTALLEALATRLTRALPGAVEDPSAAEAGEGELAAYARARQAAAPDMRARLDRAVTEPLLGALDELRPSRRARKALRDLLGA
jgi:hypothetical protein